MFLGIYNAPPDSEVEKELRGDIDDRADVDKLVKRAQNGDDEAFSSLVEIFEKFDEQCRRQKQRDEQKRRRILDGRLLKGRLA